MTNVAEDKLQGRWIHVHEEDREGRLVFRRAGGSLPPSRGRSGFELRPRGVMIATQIGAADGLEEHGGMWHLEGEILELYTPTQPPQRLRVVSQEPDRLVLESI